MTVFVAHRHFGARAAEPGFVVDKDQEVDGRLGFGAVLFDLA